MPLTVTPPPSGMAAPVAQTVTPVDLTPALDRLHNAFREGFINAQDIQKRTTIGNTDAEAKRKQNEAAGAKAEQDRKDQQGGKGYTKPGLFSRLTGIGTGPKPVVPAPAVSPTPAKDPNAAYAPAVDMPDRGPVVPGPFHQRVMESPDFNPSHESTDDLLKFVGEAGYSAQV